MTQLPKLYLTSVFRASIQLVPGPLIQAGFRQRSQQIQLMTNLHLILISCVQVIVCFVSELYEARVCPLFHQNEKTAKEPIVLCRCFAKWLAQELCKEVSSYSQYQLLHKREETSHETFSFGSDLSWQFLFWLLIPSFNLRCFFSKQSQIKLL